MWEICRLYWAVQGELSSDSVLGFVNLTSVFLVHCVACAGPALAARPFPV